MPHKYNADRRHHIPKRPFKVTNWAEYEAGLRAPTPVISEVHYALKTLAYTMINLRHFCRG